MTDATTTILHCMLAQLQPPERVAPGVWAERHLKLPRSSNARPGRLRLTAAQRGMVNAAAEPGVREIVLMLATQTGKSTAIAALLGWTITGEAGPVLLVRPDESDAKAYVREVLDPIIEASAALRNVVGFGGKGVDSIDFKTFPGGSLAVASSWKASALAGRSIRVLICDEVDRFAPVVSGGEGEPVTLARRRLQTYKHNSLTILASSPTFKATSRIAHHYSRGDQRKLFIRCLECGEADDITPKRLMFEPGHPEEARLLCLYCGCLATDTDRLTMLESAEWRSTAKGEAGVVSFQMGELASEFSDLATVAKLVDAAKTLEAKKVLQNTTWGLPFESEAEAEIDPTDLFNRAIPISEPLDAVTDFITAGVDIQLDRIEVTILASARTRLTVIDHIVIRGDTSGGSVWTNLDKLLGKVFRVADRRQIPIAATYVDAGYSTQAVIEFVVSQRTISRRVWPIFGRAGFGRADRKTGTRIRGVAPFILGVDGLRLSVVKALAADDEGIKPIFLPNHLDANYFAQLTAERLQVGYVKGYPRYVWTKERHARNEALDCLVYAYAAALDVVDRAAPAKAKGSAKTMLESMLAINLSQKESQHGNQG